MSRVAGGQIALELVESFRYQVIYNIMLKKQRIGEIELDQIAWRSGEAELRISIFDEEMRNKGYGTAAITSLLELAFGKMNLNRIYLRVHAHNPGAIRCYEKAGFKKEGRLSRRTDKGVKETIYLMGIPRRYYLKEKSGEPSAI